MSERPQQISIQRTSMLNSINRVGKVLKKIGLDPFRLNAEKLIKKSLRKASYNSQIPASVEEGLTRLVNSINTESHVNPFGSLAIKGLIERTLYGRFKIENAVNTDSSILARDIKQPVFIIGMPRTGTTILHALLHEDPSHRSPLAWECLLPYPLPSPENFHDNPNLKTIEKEFGQLFKLVPDFQKKHHMSAVSPQECLGITMYDFNSFQTCAQVYIPSYLKWFMDEADRSRTMRFHKTFLQYLESGGVTGERWLLKSPVHLMRLDAIFEVYPDARIIMTHRHPSKVVASAASLISSVRSLYSDHEDEFRTGKEQAEFWNSSFNRFLESRTRIDKEDQIIDLKFEDFVQDQMKTVRSIYEHFGWTLTENVEHKMKKFLELNPKDKHGVHNYSLDKFGLTENGIETQYRTYIEFLNQLDPRYGIEE